MPSNSKFSHNKRRIRPLSSGFLNIFIVLSGNRDSTAEPILFETSLLWKPSNHLFPPTRKLFIYTLASQVKTPWHWEIFIVFCSDGPYFWNCRGIYAACLCHSYSVILLPSQLLYYYTIFFKDFNTQLLHHNHSGLLPDISFYFMTLLFLFFSNFSFTQF